MGEANFPANGALLEALTWREQDILHLLAERHTNREIALSLGLELTTVKWYNKQLFSKLGVGSRYQAVTKAEEYGLLDEKQRAPDAEGSPPKSNLPAQITSFVGRATEVADVKRLLQEVHLLTLTGPAGTGKTRLALQAAAELAEADAFEDGIYFVDLAPVAQPDLVGDTIAEALGVVAVAGQPISERLANYLGNRKSLLILDNFEHMVEAAPLVGDLLAVAPGLRVLVTSREGLQVYGEQEFAIPPLTLPDLSKPVPLPVLADCEAVVLFNQRAQAIMRDFRLTEGNAPAVAEICVRLDGLPLAIELAAARVKLFSPQALLGQLENRLTALQGGPRGLPERQRTLRGALAWSYDLLDGAEKALFARLSVFQGGRTIEAVEAVCSHDLAIDVLDGLESLLNKNLLRHEDGPEGEPRFVMLETIHEYAREMLHERGEADDMHRRHAGYFAAFAERGYPYTRGGPKQMRWLRRLDAEYDNLRAALEWSLSGADIELGLRLAGALGYFWWRWHHLADGHRWMTRAIDADANNIVPSHVRAALLQAAGLLAIYRDDHLTGQKHHREAVALFRELGDRRNLGWAIIELSTQSIGYLDEYHEAVATCEEGLALLREVDDKAGVAHALNVLGELARLHGDYGVAKDAYEVCLSIARETGDIFREVKQHINLGFVYQHEGDHEGAKASFLQFLALALEIEFKAATGQPERAARLMGAGFAQFDQLGVTPQSGDSPQFERNRASAREQLDEAAFEAAWAEGQAMTLEEAIAYAREDPGSEQ
jgi:non-specific serine/threonine protein kinase